MSVEVYDCMSGNTLFKLELPASEVAQYVALVKAHGCEDMEGNEYKFNDAKVFCDGFIVYVENAAPEEEALRILNDCIAKLQGVTRHAGNT